MKANRLLAALALSTLLYAPLAGHAAAPATVNYQGQLSSAGYNMPKSALQPGAGSSSSGGYRSVGQFALSAPTSNNSVIEFYNTSLDNYFITADAGEAAAIDNGGAGPGWSRTGNTFNSGGSVSVCRFYGSQSPGPNSHFYTADAGECASLKQLQTTTSSAQKRWNYEGLAFLTAVPTNGACPAGATPVYRAYNNGAARGVDSNHRITTSLTAIQQVVARGWNNEGVVMCAPQ